MGGENLLTIHKIYVALMPSDWASKSAAASATA